MRNMSFDSQSMRNPEVLAQRFLSYYLGDSRPVYPLNPFQMLKDVGIVFRFSNFKKLEGVYVPASSDEDIPFVGINCNRPITRQRFTAAHELCHHIKDRRKQFTCFLQSGDEIERFAERFAAALLMPIGELRRQVERYKINGVINFDAVLQIAHYFGVSFTSCAYRIADKLHVLAEQASGNLAKKISRYKPEKQRLEVGLNYYHLYVDLVNTYSDMLNFPFSDRARVLFTTNYIYNDSRMEGIDITIEQAAEIVADLRTNKQASEYCSEQNEAFLSIAGHYEMYKCIFDESEKDATSIYEICKLNSLLYSCYPHPEFGGNFRQSDTLVSGAKFETVPYTNLFIELNKLEEEVKTLTSRRNELTKSELIEGIVDIHHRLTVIHPFGDGNGRTLRAFMNVLLLRFKINPIYIKVEEKESYRDGLEKADLTGNYEQLYEVIFRILIRTNTELADMV